MFKVSLFQGENTAIVQFPSYNYIWYFNIKLKCRVIRIAEKHFLIWS